MSHLENKFHKNMHIILIVALVVTNLFFIATTVFFFRDSNYPAKIQEKRGISEFITPNNVSQESWNSSIEQMNYDTDIVFFGDSLTIKTDFQDAYPNYKIFNFGVYGDNLTEMKNRTYVIKKLTPEKIFFLGGINSLFNSYPMDKSIETYRSIVEEMVNENPSTEIYLQSILPIQGGEEFNDNICKMNAMIQAIAEEYDLTYIDLYSYFESDGQLKAKYSEDGVHLSEEGKNVWITAIKPYIISN